MGLSGERHACNADNRNAGGTEKAPLCARLKLGRKAAPFAVQQKAPLNIGALPQKLWMRCLVPVEERQACDTASVAGNGCRFFVSGRHQMQVAIRVGKQQARVTNKQKEEQRTASG